MKTELFQNHPMNDVCDPLFWFRGKIFYKETPPNGNELYMIAFKATSQRSKVSILIIGISFVI